MAVFEATTIIAVRRGGRCAIAGDGQVTMGQQTIFKATAHKVRRLYNGRVLTGFAGSAADALQLCEMLEQRLEQFGGNLSRAAVELAREWRSDKALRRLEAMLLATDGKELLVVSGTGEVLDPDDGVAAIGSGGNYALAAGKALYRNTEMAPADIAREALKIAASICVFTNENIIVEEIAAPTELAEGGGAT